MPATARAVGSTTQPLSRAAAQIVAMPQLGPQTRGTTASSPAAASPCRVGVWQQASGQSGRSRSRRPEGAAARRSRQNSDTIVTMVQPAYSEPTDARLPRVSAVARKPAAVRATAGSPSDRQEATRSEAIARSRSRTAFDSGHRIATAVAGWECSAVGTEFLPKTVGFKAVDASCTGCLTESEWRRKMRLSGQHSQAVGGETALEAET